MVMVSVVTGQLCALKAWRWEHGPFQVMQEQFVLGECSSPAQQTPQCGSGQGRELSCLTEAAGGGEGLSLPGLTLMAQVVFCFSFVFCLFVF